MLSFADSAGRLGRRGFLRGLSRWVGYPCRA